jgi:3-hydroxyacyl-[acyl-carrier-protein] dehydratase
MIALQQAFAQNHPATLGHFPSHPILPGAFLLDAAIRAIRTAYGLSGERVQVESAKFPRSVLPGQTVDWVLEDPVAKEAGCQVKFRGSVEGEVVISGALVFPA